MPDLGRKPAPKPGFYRDIPFGEYVAWDAVNSHILTGFARTPAHVRHDLMHGGAEPTKSLDLGWLFHLAVLEPERFEADTVVPPKVDRRTKDGKATWERFQAANAGKQFVDSATLATVQRMKAAMNQHKSAHEFLSSRGVNEVSLVWEEPEVGVICKARIDRVGYIGEWPIVGDVKTARNAGRRAFERAIHDYGYHVQAQHYLAGLQRLAPIPEGQPFRRFVFPVVETEPPHCVIVYELDESALVLAEADRQKYLRTWRECVETGVWPAYGDGVDLISLPAWAFRSMEAA
jgi:exodeoxyribonuclease VIII